MSSVALPAQPERIMKELARVWTSLAEEERHQGGPTVLRACAMTLIVATDDEDEESLAASQTLTELMHAHPSRAIVLRSSDRAGEGLSAHVFAQCWKPFGKAQQICCEQIEIAARPDQWLDVGPTVLGIIVPDLPVVVWCRQKSALRSSANDRAQAGLESVLSLATKTIVDTRGIPVPEALARMREWKQRGRIVGDLEWTRLTPWRQTIAHVFEDFDALSELKNIRTVEIAYTDEVAPASALYAAAWLENGIAANAALRREEGFGPGLHRISLKSGNTSIELERTGPTCIRLNVGDKEQQISMAGSSLYELMHEELTVLGPDAVFDAAFEKVREIRS
ncbi:MAG TPA: glucose-6-phosphate dehydrogenase assembly protein OpcA [Bryobacteraceae bacterium]|jgi:glucose-6-phosphate dehydrogenase assembly protein OpcA|nr:glucose-6-phosphate dehydrogenase assembly protein OpcA [Bryobacteraceae bacterium]HXR75705.1 glucose-6-phosphate dehydrogenase assembly protein OpcA [Bryobacteraceae bacterium]